LDARAIQRQRAALSGDKHGRRTLWLYIFVSWAIKQTHYCIINEIARGSKDRTGASYSDWYLKRGWYETRAGVDASRPISS
jgi:hypothetical protein